MKDCKAERKTDIRRMVFAFAVSIAVAAMGLLAVFSVTADEAQADEGVPTIVWGTDVLKGGQLEYYGSSYSGDRKISYPTYVYYGNYAQNSMSLLNNDENAPKNPEDGDVYTNESGTYVYKTLDSDFVDDTGLGVSACWFKQTPISWLIVSNTPSGKKPASGSSSGTGYNDEQYEALSDWNDGDGLYLLSEYALDNTSYHTEQEKLPVKNADGTDYSGKKALTYQTSSLRSWLNGYTAAYNIADAGDDKTKDEGIDYSAYGDNFLSLAFTSQEKAQLIESVIDNPDYSGTKTLDGEEVSYTVDGGDATQDFVFTMSKSEALGYLQWKTEGNNDSFVSANPMATFPSYYAMAGGSNNTNTSGFGWQAYWWLRNIGQSSSWSTDESGNKYVIPYTNLVYSVYGNMLFGSYGNYSTMGTTFESFPPQSISYFCTRPSVNLSTDDVLFASSAARSGLLLSYGTLTENNISAKSEEGMDKALTVMSKEDAIHSWKLTMKADNYGKFTAKTIRTDEDKNTITISYAGATTGTNQNISILVKDATFTGDASNISSVESALNGDGDFSAYGRVLTLDGTTNGASGTATFTLPDGLTWEDLEGKTIYVYNEQYNGETATDYASNLVPISLSAEKYTVTYDMNGGTLIDGKSDVKDSNSYQWGDEATVLSGEGVYQKPVDGTTDKYMTCTGWNTKADGSGTAYAAGSELSISDSNVKLYAQYEDKNQKYTISYDTNDGSDVTDKETGEKISDDGEPNQEEGYADDVIDLSERTTSRDDGAIFMGWYDNAELSGDPITSVQLTGNTTLYAAWGWEVTFDADGGELASGTEEKVSILEGTAVTKPADPTREGYTFKGWRIEGSDEDYDFSAAITGSIKLVAQWEKLPDEPDTDDLTPEVNTDSNGTSSASGSKSTADTGDSSHVVLFAAVSLLIALGLGVYTGVWIRTRRRQR